MFGKKDSRPTVETFFGPNGSATVFRAGSGMFSVTGSGNHDGTYFRVGDMVSGPNGTYTVMGTVQSRQSSALTARPVHFSAVETDSTRCSDPTPEIERRAYGNVVRFIRDSIAG